ncbi:MAG: WYL domain-containing protein [Myxococcales bacterium]|nr:WYL domain-containing protein [Myxococcales bacterium]MCB9706633.1 WYL domain-containing protein [Myxococcales bacterium]
MPRAVDRYAPARRLDAVRDVLNATGGATVYEIAERLECSVRTALRYLKALEESGAPLYEELDGKRKVWRLMASARHQTITLTTSQMVALAMSRRVFDFLAGTGFKEDLDEVFERLEVALKRADFVAARNLDRKIYDVNEAPHRYEGRIDHVNDIVTALIKEERLRVTYARAGGGESSFTLDPYTLLVYKKGLYLVGYSHRHEEMRTFSLDAFREVTWLSGEGFEYPEGYHPSSIADGAFGLIKGEPCHVRIRFDRAVARYVQRRIWHPSQRLVELPGGALELHMDVLGFLEIRSWVLSFGDKAEVLEPAGLRQMVEGELRRALERYQAAAVEVAEGAAEAPPPGSRASLGEG